LEQIEQSIKALHKQIPASTPCKSGCSDCCGPVPVSAHEAEALGVSGSMTPVKPGTMTCAFWDNGCTVYENRPFMCRLFGSCIDDVRLKCPHGSRPLLPLNRNDADRLAGEYMRLTYTES